VNALFRFLKLVFTTQPVDESEIDEIAMRGMSPSDRVKYGEYMIKRLK
jgi:hypothetical protein